MAISPLGTGFFNKGIDVCVTMRQKAKIGWRRWKLWFVRLPMVVKRLWQYLHDFFRSFRHGSPLTVFRTAINL